MPRRHGRSKTDRKNFWIAASATGLIVALAVAGLLFVPMGAGAFGLLAKTTFLKALGWAGFSLPFFLLWSSQKAWSHRREPWGFFAFVQGVVGLPLLGFLVVSLIFALIAHPQADIAGFVSLGILDYLKTRVGILGAGFVILALSLLWLKLAFNVALFPIFKKALALLYEDWLTWKKLLQARRALKIKIPTPPQSTVPPPKQILIQEKLPDAVSSDGKKPMQSPVPKVASPNGWVFPPLDLLLPQDAPLSRKELLELCESRSKDLIGALTNFEVFVELSGIVPGPVVTRYDLIPQPGVKVGEIASLTNDIALALKVASVRILGPIAGKGAIGIEVPNPQPQLVRLREVLEDPLFHQSDGALVFALGRAASGEATVCHLAEMPHLLIAGATNSGKSVLIHALVVSFLYRFTPEELKLILIDPKRLELPFYAGIPHLFDPRKSCDEVTVITDAKEASRTLTALVDLMEYRYEKFAAKSVRNIEAYNTAACAKKEPIEPYIVVVIDELADLMLISGREVEMTIQRLAQMARAVGIHLVLSTQRPSVDVITGVIKANLPARIALQVVSKTDSRVILDTQDAEDLLGAGDMLYLASGAQRPLRLQGAFVTDDEIARVVKHWRAQGPPQYPQPAELLGKPVQPTDGTTMEEQNNLAKALSLVLERRRVSQDLLKAHFGSSAKATDLLSRLEVGGFIFKPEGTNRWEIRFDKIEEYLNKLVDR